MPKLPQNQNSSEQEIVDKRIYSTGKISIPKAPKPHIVFNSHIKLALVLLSVVVVFSLIYLVGKPILNLWQPRGVSQEMVRDVDKFKSPDEKAIKYLKLEYSLTLIVDRVDLDNHLIYAKEEGSEGNEYVVRVVPGTKIQKLPEGNKPVVFATDSADLRKIEDITPGVRLSVVATEDPHTEKYLNAAAVIIG